ncbi:hypothetical protein SAMN05660489_03613 [Pseudomonas sp. LAMO17WK12:I10]|nr:hypothetical protein H160_03748 [Pseudomonas sp. LAMO17WK12:I9]SNY39154.1 hypothetical protein SAMN05660489_03613 [Pseudomonas sp. LAMO17WK12:I10]
MARNRSSNDSNDSQAELAKQSLNPVTALYSVPIQYNWNQKLGPSGEGYQSVTKIQPVLPFSFNDEWNLISRTILPVTDQHGLVLGGQADKSGINDVTQSFFFSPKHPTASGWIWGAGPTVVALKSSNGWTRGVLANHIWSLENSPPDDKDKINQTFL